MAHFMCGAQGSRGSVSRLGGKGGASAFVRGWDFGVRVEMHYDENAETDVAFVTLTGGSNGRISSQMLGRFTIADLEKLTKKAAKAFTV